MIMILINSIEVLTQASSLVENSESASKSTLRGQLGSSYICKKRQGASLFYSVIDSHPFASFMVNDHVIRIESGY